MPNQVFLSEEDKQAIMEYASPNSDVTHILAALNEKHEREADEQAKRDSHRFIVSTIIGVIAAVASIVAAVVSILTYLS